MLETNNRLGFGEQSPRQFNEDNLAILLIQIRVLTGAVYIRYKSYSF